MTPLLSLDEAPSVSPKDWLILISEVRTGSVPCYRNAVLSSYQHIETTLQQEFDLDEIDKPASAIRAIYTEKRYKIKPTLNRSAAVAAGSLRNATAHGSFFLPTREMAFFCVFVWAEIWESLTGKDSGLEPASEIFFTDNGFSSISKKYTQIPTLEQIRESNRFKQLQYMVAESVRSNIGGIMIKNIQQYRWLFNLTRQLKNNTHNGSFLHHTPLVPKYFIDIGEQYRNDLHRTWCEVAAKTLHSEIMRISGRCGVPISDIRRGMSRPSPDVEITPKDRRGIIKFGDISTGRIGIRFGNRYRGNTFGVEIDILDADNTVELKTTNSFLSLGRKYVDIRFKAKTVGPGYFDLCLTCCEEKSRLLDAYSISFTGI